MAIRSFATLIILASGLISFSFAQKNKQGIEGYIYFVKGNRMPSPNVKLPEPKGYATTLYIYELTNQRQAHPSNQASFYSSISTKLVKTAKSDKNGHFKVNLPPGNYSLFVKKDSLYYANLFEGDNINPAKVETGKFTQVKMNVDYEATY